MAETNNHTVPADSAHLSSDPVMDLEGKLHDAYREIERLREALAQAKAELADSTWDRPAFVNEQRVAELKAKYLAELSA